MVGTGDDARVMAWTNPVPRRDDPPSTPAALTIRPVHPLPGRVAPPRRPATRGLPTGFGALLVTTLVAGSPWGDELLRELRVNLPRVDGPAGIVTTVVDALLLGLSWLRWGGPDTLSSYHLARTAQVALFVVIVLVMLRRLAAGGTPPGAYRFLGTLGATVLAAALATVGGALAHLAVDSGVYVGSEIRAELLNELVRALLCGFVVGLLLAAVPARRHRSRPAVPGLGGD
ncbi:hypothetical protein ENC19_26990 [Verrucosispora sp. CWR15]|uniref:Uncharacterized protein n=1 Tax=Verrucosispora sioxanthis TaxID=2499994 RepID=A0A6M1LCM4_9ACTN|nr:hypothetical protein [Verrucosispora sioxanthis]NEE66906.1 hypothetical protein [Verrucosispora sioxanthis]NGM16016.1 hypothetical protein [Verrucosispora sioxanthis]